MPFQTISDNKAAVESLRSPTCPACGAGKTPMRTLCGGCYARLPSALATALYRRVFEGYLEAVQAALKYLAGTPARMATCRSCPAPIVFAQQNPTPANPHPKSNPLNAQPHAEGNLRLDLKTMRYEVLTGQTLAEARIREEPLYLSHFADCPNRNRFGAKAAGKRARA